MRPITKKHTRTLAVMIPLLLGTIYANAQQQQDLSVEQTEIIKISGITTEDMIYGLNATQKTTSKTYYDGLGRPVQQVLVQGSPTQKDIVQPIGYDNQGRQNRGYLPYVGTDGSGNFRPNALTSEQPAFYNNGTSDKIADDTNPYSEQLFENSPLQRVLSTGGVGYGFQPLSGQHYSSMSYRSNTSSDGNIIMWSPDGSNSGNYGANALSVIEATDTEGHKAFIFKDDLGRTILKRQVVNATTNNDTYYIYNNAGLVSYVLPPKAVNLLAANSSYTLATPVISKLIFTYTYDNKGRLTEKTIPGAGAISMVYDPLDRLVLAQNAKLKASNQWNYIKYDVRGNAIAQGIYTDNTRTTLAAMQTYVSGLNYSTNWYEKRGTSSTTGYYTNVTFPTSSKTDLAFSYYDDYDINSDGVANYSYLTQGLTGEATATTQIRGMLTMVRKYTVGAAGGTWIMSVIFYDKRGNVIQERSSNQITTSTNDTKTIVPDFTGTPKQTKVVKSVNSVSTTVLSTYTYDHMQRVTAIDQSYNGGATIRVAGYEYNELGQLVDKKLGSTNGGSTYLQSIDYRYNIKGQLTSINNSKLSNDGVKNDDINDLFGIELLYNQADANVGNTAYYDGSLSAVKWMSKNAANTSSYERSYKYSYDGLNRLTAANYAERTTAGTGAFNYNVNGFSEKNITYDENGNIQTLKRNSSAPGAANIVEVDNLTFTFDAANPNQLKNVADGTTANHTGYGFRNLTGTTMGNYAYDAAGNLTADPYKGLTLAYNYLNRTDKITITSGTGRYINYTYTSDGVLIKKQQYDNSNLQKTTDYIDGFVYENGTLAYFAIPEGRVRNVSGTLKAEYVITDHQGNARISFEDNGSGTAVVKQENSYYAFGLTMANSPVATPTQPNKNLYNGGSEWQNDFDNLPDYYQTYYRNYDAALGRFIAVDPIAEATESMTVYQYSANNPIMFNDPLGDKHISSAYPVEMPEPLQILGIFRSTGRISREMYWSGVEGAFIKEDYDPFAQGPYAAYWQSALSFAADVIEQNTTGDAITFSGEDFMIGAGIENSISNGDLAGATLNIENGELNISTSSYIASTDRGSDGTNKIDLNGSFQGRGDIARIQHNIVRIAKSHEGSTAWAFEKARAPFLTGSNKCNLYVYEVLKKAGASPGLPHYHNTNPPTAGDWGNPDFVIPGWRVLGLKETPMPGDVVAIRSNNYTNATGHVGIVVGPNLTSSATGDKVIQNGWGFRPEEVAWATYRRYVGK